MAERSGSTALPGNLARRARAEENQAEAEDEFGHAGNAGNIHDAARFDQHPLIADHFLLFLGGKGPVWTDQRRDGYGEEDDSKNGVEGDLHARCTLFRE